MWRMTLTEKDNVNSKKPIKLGSKLKVQGSTDANAANK